MYIIYYYILLLLLYIIIFIIIIIIKFNLIYIFLFFYFILFIFIKVLSLVKLLTAHVSFSPDFHPAQNCSDEIARSSVWLHSSVLQTGKVVSIRTSLGAPELCVAPQPATNVICPGTRRPVGRQIGRM